MNPIIRTSLARIEDREVDQDVEIRANEYEGEMQRMVCLKSLMTRLSERDREVRGHNSPFEVETIAPAHLPL